jgi:hypothetical protein
MVSAEALGEKGREVRCGKCSHRWFQEPPRDSLDELQSLVETIHQDESETGSLKSASISAPSASISESLSNRKKSEDIKLNRSPKEILKESKRETKFSTLKIFYAEQQKSIAGFLLALAMIAILTLGILLITRGWYEPKPSPFMIDGLRSEQSTSGDELSGSFRVINLSDKAQTLPNFKVKLLSNTGRILSVQSLEIRV